MKKMSESQELIYELSIRFQQKPRLCKKLNDSDVGNSLKIVSVENGWFFYYHKFQEFKDLDFDKLKYAQPKLGIKLTDILELRFPPRHSNERNYFTIVVPTNQICKYNKKTGKQMLMDENAEGETHWTFLFPCDIISLPQLEQRSEARKAQQRQKLLRKKQKEEEQEIRKQNEDREKVIEQQKILTEAEKVKEQKGNKQQQQAKRKKQESDLKAKLQKIDKQADQLYFHEAYRNLGVPADEIEHIELELALLKALGNFKKRAEQVVKKYIDQLPFNLNLVLDQDVIVDNFLVKIGFDKNLNLDYLDQKQVAHVLYNIRRKLKIGDKIRVPLTALIKYKGFKILVKAITPLIKMTKKQKDQSCQHGVCDQTWKRKFSLIDDLNFILDELNLKCYSTQQYVPKVQIHFGIHVEIIQTKLDPFGEIKSISQKSFSELTKQSIMYLINISEVFPIDLNFEKTTKQNVMRLRPEYVRNYSQHGEIIKLSAGALTYECEDDQGTKDDLAVSKASQNLKYDHLINFVDKLDRLEQIPMSSEHLKKIMEENGINIRYIPNIYKLTALPYIREMFSVEIVAREIKKIYRDYQKDFVCQFFRTSFREMIAEAYDEKSMTSKKSIRMRQLGIEEKKLSIENSIDFLNLIFGKSHQTEKFWEAMKYKVSQKYDIIIKNHTELPHGYLLVTVLYHCGFTITLNSDLVLFSTLNPFSSKDWVQFACRTSCFTFPSIEVYNKCKITENLTVEQIKTRLQISLSICRMFGNDQSKILSQLAHYLQNPKFFVPKQKFTIQNLQYQVSNASMENFNTAYEICAFLFPSNHPYFQHLYLSYAKLKTTQTVKFKKAASKHAIRTLGLSHWRTSEILEGFEEDQHLNNLKEAERGVAINRKIGIYHKIIGQLTNIGKYTQSYQYALKAIEFAENKTTELSQKDVELYLQLLMKAIDGVYRLRRIQDMILISQNFWNALEKYKEGAESHHHVEDLLFYCLKGFLECRKEKHYLFKIVLFLNSQIQNEKGPKTTKDENLANLRIKCRESLNHVNWIKQMLAKLQHAKSEINYLQDFFIQFQSRVKILHSEELNEGLEELEIVLRVFGKQYFQKALVDKSYCFYRKSKLVTN